MWGSSDILAYLDSIRLRYPYGVPRKRPRTTSRILFLGSFGGLSEDDLFASPSGLLLRNAITKGLKLDLSEVKVVSEDSLTKENATQHAVHFNPQCAVILGGVKGSEPIPVGSGGFTYLENIPTFVTHSLENVAAHADAKREFWEDLKRVLKFLGA